MGVTLDELVAPITRDDARAQLLVAAAGLGFPQVDGDSEGTIALSGTPNGAYDMRVNVLGQGSAATASYRYSLDGGTTYSAPVTPGEGGAYLLPNTGVTLTLTGDAADAFLLGDTYTVQTFAPPLPTTSWSPFAVPRVLIEVFATAFSFLLDIIRKIAAGGLNSLSTGKWLTLLSHEVYSNDRFSGVAAQGYATVADTAGAGPFTLAAGVFLIKTTGGLRYRAVNTVTLPKNGSVLVLMQAESPGSQYNVGGAALTVLGTSLPGVTATNASSWRTVEGTDDETDAALQTRNVQKWSSLSPSFTDDGYAYYAKQAAPGEVTRTHSRVSPSVAGEADLFLANTTGGVTTGSGSTVEKVQNYLDQRMPDCCTVNVQTATPHVFTIAGTAYYFSSHSTTVDNDTNTALINFFSSVAIGGTMYLSQLVDALQDVPGMRNVDLDPGLSDTALTDTEVATWVRTLSFVPVSG